MRQTDSREILRERRQAGWVGALAALLALVAVGFLGGALLGFLWEEPRLVVAYLSGETDSVEWSDPAPSLDATPDPVDVAAAPPEPEPVPAREPEPAPPAAEPAPVPKAPPEAKRAEAPGPEPKAPAPAAAEPAAPEPAPVRTAARTATESGRFAVQVGAFSENGSAERLVSRLKGRGYSAYVAPSSGAAPWRVRVGPVPTRPEAERLAEKLESAEQLSTWVLDENAT